MYSSWSRVPLWLVFVIWSLHVSFIHGANFIQEPPFIRTGKSQDDTQTERNITFRVGVSGIVQSAGESILVPVDTLTGSKAHLNITFHPTKVIMRATRRMLLQSELQVMKFTTCTAIGHALFDDTGQTTLPNALIPNTTVDQGGGGNETDTGGFLYNAYVQPRDPAAYAAAYDPLSPTGFQQAGAPAEDLTNRGRTLLSTEDSECLPQTAFPCKDVCVLKAPDSQARCREFVRGAYEALPLPRPKLYGSLLQGQFHSTEAVSFDDYMSYVLSRNPNAQLIDLPYYSHSVPTATCHAPAYNVSEYLRLDTSFVFPNTEAASCTPLTLDDFPTADECAALGRGSDPSCLTTRLIDLSAPYSDNDIFYGTSAAMGVFQNRLRYSLVNMTDTCGQHFRTRDRPISEAALYTTDYFEPSLNTPCLCTLRQFSQYQRSCVENPWDITGPDGSIPIWPQTTKCKRTRGLWTCAPFLTPEITRDLSKSIQYDQCKGRPPRGVCAQKTNLDTLQDTLCKKADSCSPPIADLIAQADASCNETVSDLFAGRWETQNSTLNDDLQITDPNSISDGSEVVTYSSGISGLDSSTPEKAWCGVKNAFGDSCDCSQYHLRFEDDRPQEAIQDSVNGYALSTQALALDVYQQGLGNLTQAVTLSQTIGLALIRTATEVQSTLLANDISIANFAKTITAETAQVSAHAQQLELLARRWGETMTTRYDAQLARAQGLQDQLEATRNSLGQEIAVCQQQVSLMRVALEHKRRVMEKIHLLNSASRLTQLQFQEAMTELITGRSALRRLIQGGNDHMRRIKAATNLNPLVVGGADELGNYGFTGRELTSNERIWSIEMSRVWYLTPTYLARVPADDSDLVALLKQVIDALRTVDPDDVGGDVFLALNFTTPEQDQVQMYMNTSFDTVDVHQLSMQLQCDAKVMIDFHGATMDMDTLRSWIGPDSCILGSHLPSRTCRCRTRLIHRLCTHQGSPQEAAALLSSPGWPSQLALDSSTVAATGLCTSGQVTVRVPIWNRAGPASTEPVDTGLLTEVDRFWLDTCLGAGNDPSAFDHTDFNSTLEDVQILEATPQTNGLVSTLPCAFSDLNLTAFANATAQNLTDPCLGVRAPLQLQLSNDPASVGSRLEARLPIFNHTELGGFLVYSDGMGRATFRNRTMAFDPTQCSANYFQSLIWMDNRPDGQKLMYFMVQQLAANALLAALRSPRLRQLEYVVNGMWAIGVVTSHSMLGPTPERIPPSNPQGIASQPDISLTTGILEYNPLDLPFQLEIRNQTKDTEHPLLWTSQGISTQGRTLAQQRRDCYSLAYLAGQNFSIPVYELEFVLEHKHVSVRVVGIETNGTLMNSSLTLDLLNQRLDRDWVDRSIASSIRSEVTTLLVEPDGQNLLFIGHFSGLLGLPVNYTAVNATEQRATLHPAVAHQVNGTKLPPPIPSRNPVLNVDPVTYEVTTHEQRGYYFYDPPTAMMRSLYNERLPGGLGYWSLQWPTVVVNDSGFATNFGGGPNGLQPIDVPSVARPQDWNAYARMPMFPPEEFFAQRGYDFTNPQSVWRGWNPEGGAVDPSAYLTLLREIQSNPNDPARSVRWLECASRPASEQGRWCAILNNFRLVDTYEESDRTSILDLGVDLSVEEPSGAPDPNPEKRRIVVLEATHDQQSDVVTLTLPEGLLAGLVVDSQPCPSSFSVVNAFRDNTTIEISRPLEAADMVFRLDITSLDTEDSCDGSQLIVIQGFQNDSSSTRIVSVPLFDCRPVSINLTRMETSPVARERVCWNWTASTTDLSLNPGTDNLDVAFEEERNTRSLFVAAATLLFSSIAGAASNLVVSLFYSDSDFTSLVQSGDIVFPTRGDIWLPPTQLPGLDENATAFFNGTLIDIPSNYTYVAQTQGRAFYNVVTTTDGFNVTQLQLELEAIYNASLSNSSALIDLIDLVNNQSLDLMDELERRKQELEDLSELARRIGALNITNAELADTLQTLVNEALNLTFDFQPTIDILLKAGFRNITQQAWICLLLLGNSDVMSDPVAAAHLLGAQKEMIHIRKEIFDLFDKDCTGPTNFACGRNGWIRTLVWYTVAFLGWKVVETGVYFGLMKSEVCGKAPRSLVKDGFGREPPRPSEQERWVRMYEKDFKPKTKTIKSKAHKSEERRMSSFDNEADMEETG